MTPWLRVPRRRPDWLLDVYVGAVILLGAAVGLGAAWELVQGVPAPSNPALAVVLALAMLLSELVPLGLKGRDHNGFITISLAYAFALLFVLPGLSTAVVVAAASALADTVRGTVLRKTLFNAAMMGLSMAAGHGVLVVTNSSDLIHGDLLGLRLGGVLLAAAAVYLVNSILIIGVMTLVTGDTLQATFKRDLWASLPTDGLLLPLGPVMVVVGSFRPTMLPFAMLLTWAVYRSAQYAAERDREATHDHLTDLPNRRHLDVEIEEALERVTRTGGAAAVMLLDLNGFKGINDTFGHQAGDEVLVEIAGRIRSLMEDGAVASRLGGDEFAVLLPSVASLEEAELVALQIGEAVRVPLRLTQSTTPVSLGAAIGIALTGPDAGSATELLRSADAAMYQAKRTGHGHMVANSETVGADRYAELERAIADDELFLVFEPLLDARTEAVMGFEALVRWERPGHGIVPPAEFIPFAEQSPLIKPLTRWVVDAGLAHLAELHRAGHMVGISINVSARNMTDPGFAAEVLRTLEQHGVDGAWLTLEITETAVMHHTAASRHTMQTLVDHGIKLALDDFGAGHSSLAQIRDLPISVVKIDRSFLVDPDVERSHSILRAFVTLAHSLGLTSTAEGVQSRAVIAQLAEMGCDLVQGHWISKPLRASESAAWLAGRASLDPTSRRDVAAADVPDLDVAQEPVT